MLLAIAMVITSITVWPEQKEVQAASDYVELTFSDFGLEDDIYTGPSWSTNSKITTLDGVAITGEMLFLSTGAHAGFRLDPLSSNGNDDWVNYQIYRVDSDEYKGLVVTHTGPGETSDTLYFNETGLGVTDWNTDRIGVRLCFNKVSDTSISVTVTMSLGTNVWTQTGTLNGVADMVSCSSGYRIGPAGEVVAPGIGLYSVARDYAELTFSSFEITDDTYTSTFWKTNSAFTSMDGVAFTGDFNFLSSGQHTAFRLDPVVTSEVDDDWYNFQIYRDQETIYVRHFGADSFKLSTDETKEMDFTSSELGGADLSATTVRVRICFGKLSDTTMSVKVTLTAGEVSITKTGIMTGVSEMVSCSTGYRIGAAGSVSAPGVTFGSVEKYTEITFSNFDISDDTYTSAFWKTNSALTSMNGVAFTGDFNFLSSGQHTAFRLDPVVTSEVDDDWYNFQVYRDGETLYVRHFGADSFKLLTDPTQEMNFSSTELGGADLSATTVRVRICFGKLSDTTMSVKVTLTAGEVSITKTGIMTGVSEMISCSSGYRIGAAGGTASPGVTFGSVDVTQEEPTEEGPITLTFSDLGIPDGNYAGTSKEGKLPSGISSWDNVTVEGYVMMPSDDANAFLGIAGSDSKSEGLKLFASSSEQIWFWNTLNDNTNKDSVGLTAGETDKTDSANVLGNVTGEYMKMSITYKYVENDLNMIVVINDTWTLDWIFTDIVDLIGRKVIVSGNVTVASIMEYTELTFEQLGFEDGNYSGQTVAGKLPTNVDSWHRVAVTGYLGFYGTGADNAFRIGAETAANSIAMFYADNQIYVWNSVNTGEGIIHGDFKTGELNSEGNALGELYETPLKVRFEFAEYGNDLNVRIVINDAWEDTKTYENGLDIVQNKFCMTGNVTVGLPKEPLAVSFNSFGMEANKILGMTTASTMVPENATTLDDMKFTGYVTFFNATDDSTHVTFGVNEAGNGIQMFVSGDTLWVWDKTGGRTAAGLGECFDSFSASTLGLETLVGQELKVEISFEYSDAGVTVYYAINGVEKTSYQTVAGYAQYIGTGIKVTSSGNPIAYRSLLTEEYSVANRLSAEGYKRVTVTDFDGIEYDKVYQGGTFTGRYKNADTMDGTYLDMDVKFEDIVIIEGDGAADCIRYGGNGDGWTGIDIRSNGEYNTFEVGGQAISYSAIGIESMEDDINIKIALKETTIDGVQWYLMSAWINDMQICSDKQMVNGTIGNVFLLWVPAEHKEVTTTSKVTFMPAEYTEVTNNPVSYSLRGYDHTTVQNYLVTGDATVTKNGAVYTVTNNQISEPGDYTIVTTVASTAHRYTQVVSLYILGDVDLNGTAGEQADLDALQGMVTKIPYDTTTAAEYAADLDNDGTVDKKDLELLESVVGDADKLTTVLKQYHVPALTYDYLGGDDVMPISGYFGPYADSTRSYLTENIYQLIKDSGINIINHSVNDAGYELSYVREALELADKFGLGWFVSDYKLNPKINVLNNNAVDADAEMLTTAQLAARLSLYSYYNSFLGNHIKDEPSYNGGDENQDYNMLDYYTDASAKLNSFANTLGMINIAAEDARTINNYRYSWTTSFGKTDNYDEFWAQYVADAKPKVYSADDYQFFGTAGTDDAKSYFRTLGKIRNQSLENDTPFWYYVQVGGDFDHDNATTNTNKIATEAETYWCLNTALAFGAKGIEWFPTIQPTYFDGISDPSTESSVDRNGLILSDGTTSTYYAWVKTANAQIAAVDDVLMKATNKAIVATGTYAVREIEEEGCTTTASSYGKLKGVTASNTTQGAVVGCFDYRDTQAFYVMNYSVDGEQTITLTFDNNYDVRIVQDAVNTCGRTMTDKTITLTLGAGKGALVVLESTEDQVCYYCQTENADGDVIFKCQHGGVSENAGKGELYGDIDISDDVNAIDLVRMKKVEAEKEKLRFLGIADLNGDRLIDVEDLKLLRRYLIGWISGN